MPQWDRHFGEGIRSISSRHETMLQVVSGNPEDKQRNHEGSLIQQKLPQDGMPRK